MTSLKNKTKDWIQDQIFEHTKRFIAWLLSIFGLGILLFLRNWLKADHSLTLPGWSWTLLVLALPSLPLVLYIAVAKARIRRAKYLTESNDVNMALVGWLKNKRLSDRQVDVRARYTNIDRICELKPGTAKEMLPPLLDECPWVTVEGLGKDTITLAIASIKSEVMNKAFRELRK